MRPVCNKEGMRKGLNNMDSISKCVCVNERELVNEVIAALQVY